MIIKEVIGQWKNFSKGGGLWHASKKLVTAKRQSEPLCVKAYHNIGTTVERPSPFLSLLRFILGGVGDAEEASENDLGAQAGERSQLYGCIS